MKQMTYRPVIFWALACLAITNTVWAETVWHDASKLTIQGKGWQQGIATYRRLPEDCKDKIPGAVWQRSGHSAGLIIQFQTNSQKIDLRWILTSDELSFPHMPATGVSGIDLYKKTDTGKWVFTDNARPKEKTNTYSVNTGDISGQLQDYKIYLPLYNGLESLEIGITKGCTFQQPPAATEKPIVYYGTSIAQGACASRPGMAYTAMLERNLNHEIINLGFSGAGRMEQAVAETIAQIPAKIFVIDCLWNLTSIKPEELKKRIINLTKTLRNAHPKAPIVFVGQSHFKGPHPTANSLIQQKTVEKLQNEGLKKIYLIDGTNLVGSDGDGTVDKCHPNDLGMMRHTEVLEPKLRQLLEQEQ